MNKNDLMKAVKTTDAEYITGNLYDYIANHYWQMSREELKDVLLEVIYTLDNVQHHRIYCDIDTDKIKKDLIENLNNRIDDEED